MSWFDSVSDRIKDFGGIAIDNFKGGFEDANSMFDAARDHISEGRILDGAGSVAAGMGAATANVLTAGGAHAIGDKIAKSGKLDGLFDALEQNKTDVEKGRSYINEFWKDVASNDAKQGSVLGALKVGAAGAATFANEATFGQAGAFGVRTGEFAADAKAWSEKFADELNTISTAQKAAKEVEGLDDETKNKVKEDILKSKLKSQRTFESSDASEMLERIKTARQTAEANETKSAKGMFTNLAENVKRSVEDMQSRIQERETATPIADAFKAGFGSVADAAKRVGENVHEHAEASPIIDAFKNAMTGAAAGAVASAANKGRGGEFDYILDADGNQTTAENEKQ